MFRTNSLFLRKSDGDPPVLQPLPNVVQTYKYLQVADMPVQTTPIFRSLKYRMSGINFGMPALPWTFRVIAKHVTLLCRSQWPRGLWRRSAAGRVLRSWVWIPMQAWVFVCCECCVLSGRGLCHELITSPEESYRLWCIVVCDQETSRMRKPWPGWGRSATKKILCFTTYPLPH
jgi:hypothetical protein